MQHADIGFEELIVAGTPNLAAVPLPVSSPLPCRLPPPRFSASACASCVGMRSGWYIEADEMAWGLVAAFITGLGQVVPARSRRKSG